MPTYVVTGGAGFIGTNFVRLVLRERPDVHVVNLDLLTYAGNLANLDGLPEDRHTFRRVDITLPEAVADAVPEGADALVNFAAESHVDRSILGAVAFAHTNVVGTQVLLDVARQRGVKRYLQVSTDEVYGSLGPEDTPFTEATPLAPSSPYAASKAGADHLVHAAGHTFGLEACITRCANNYGPWHFPEKLIPLVITNALEDVEIPVYGDGRQVRDWIHAEDHARAILAVLDGGRPGAVYNVGARCERYNLDVVKMILGLTGKPESLIRYVTDRPGHDRRYAMDPTLLETELDWKPRIDFEDGLAATVEWYRQHRAWWQAVKDGSYRQFYETWYGGR